jgi:RNA polymerase sigma-70 factor (ECF subfamily)
VELHHLQGRSLAEVAAELGLSSPAVAGLLHRGLQKLRELLEDPG